MTISEFIVILSFSIIHGAMDIHKLIGKLPRPKRGWVLPGHNYTGPYNPLSEQLDENDLPIVKPYNKVDEVSMRHDICYRDHPKDKRGCDEVMLHDLDLIQPENFRERIDKSLVKGVITAKNKLGLGIKWTNNLADELHKPLRHNFQKRRVFVRNVDDIWGVDLVDMQNLSRDNDGYKYILMIIDVFSKYGWAVPLRTKTADEVSEALRCILLKNRPKKIWSDKGNEFYNQKVKRLLTSHKIKLYSTENPEKCSVVERWNRTIKTWLWKYFTANGTHKYIDILQSLIDKYNSTRNRAIGFTPNDARKAKNRHYVFRNLYKKKKTSHPKFKIGDKVRLAIQKNMFEKAYVINWTDKVYTIKKVQNTTPPTYKVENHKATFYEQDLQKVKEDRFRIEKILDWKKMNGKKYGLIKWIGYDDSYNSWEPEEEIQYM